MFINNENLVQAFWLLWHYYTSV